VSRAFPPEPTFFFRPPGTCHGAQDAEGRIRADTVNGAGDARIQSAPPGSPGTGDGRRPPALPGSEGTGTGTTTGPPPSQPVSPAVGTEDREEPPDLSSPEPATPCGDQGKLRTATNPMDKAPFRLPAPLLPVPDVLRPTSRFPTSGGAPQAPRTATMPMRALPCDETAPAGLPPRRFRRPPHLPSRPLPSLSGAPPSPRPSRHRAGRSSRKGLTRPCGAGRAPPPLPFPPDQGPGTPPDPFLPPQPPPLTAARSRCHALPPEPVPSP
jgi:hypothetical protein